MQQNTRDALSNLYPAMMRFMTATTTAMQMGVRSSCTCTNSKPHLGRALTAARRREAAGRGWLAVVRRHMRAPRRSSSDWPGAAARQGRVVRATNPGVRDVRGPGAGEASTLPPGLRARSGGVSYDAVRTAPVAAFKTCANDTLFCPARLAPKSLSFRASSAASIEHQQSISISAKFLEHLVAWPSAHSFLLQFFSSKFFIFLNFNWTVFQKKTPPNRTGSRQPFCQPCLRAIEWTEQLQVKRQTG
jgi:hypothetical protein